jgi:hypothetical protein
MKKSIFAVPLLVLAGIVRAEPTGEPVTITVLRAYTSASDPVAFLEVSSSALCGTSAFAISLNIPGGKEMYAAALTAFVTKQKVRLEIANATGCQGWGTRLQSIFLVE